MALRRILVTGAGGFVGGHLMPALRLAFPDAAVLPSSPDLTDAAAVAAEIREIRPDACVHLAAISAVGLARDDPDAAWRVNLHGTLGLARVLLAHAPSCALLFASTADAYGRSFLRGVPLDETAPLAPMNVYGATKAAADLALGAMAGDGLRVVRLRAFNHTGPGQSGDFVVPAFARQVARIAAGLQPPVLDVGALDPLRDFLDVRDVCAAYAACLARLDELPPGVILNIASGTPRRVGDILNDLLQLAGIAADIATDPARMRPSEIALAQGDPASAQHLLGWTPQIAWRTTLTDVLADWTSRVRMDHG